MIAELTILPLGEGAHLSEALVPVLELIERSGLEHQVTPMGTLIEGSGEELWPLLRLCHEAARRAAPRVVTEVRLDDGAGARLAASVRHLEHRLGRSVSK